MIFSRLQRATQLPVSSPHPFIPLMWSQQTIKVCITMKVYRYSVIIIQYMLLLLLFEFNTMPLYIWYVVHFFWSLKKSDHSVKLLLFCLVLLFHLGRLVEYLRKYNISKLNSLGEHIYTFYCWIWFEIKLFLLFKRIYERTCPIAMNFP